MAFRGNVYGTPITDETLKRMPAYAAKEVISKRDRAQVAMYFITSENKDATARQRVEELKRQWGDSVSTLCLVYNATGDASSLLAARIGRGTSDLHARKRSQMVSGVSSSMYVNRAMSSGSKAAIVYRDKTENGVERGWMLAWDNHCNDFCYDKES